jgi:hypothetical protein
MAIASLGLVPVGLGWCFMGPGSYWLGYALSIAGAALWTGVEVANLNYVLQFSGSDNGENGGSAYVAVNSVIINIAGCFGGLSAGLIAKFLKDWHWNPGIPGIASIGFYEILFALSGVMRLLAAVVFLPQLVEPHAGSTVEALRFMTANIYNNLFNAILAPLRFLRLHDREKNLPPIIQPRPMRKAA